MADVNRQWCLVARPDGMVKERDFAYREAEVPQPGDGELLVRTLYLSFDPAMRSWMEDRPSYIPPVPLGEPMRASAVAQVLQSHAPGFAHGDFVQGMFGWQDYAVARPGGPVPVLKLPPGVPLTWPLGVLGVTGLTAYFGLLDVGRPKAGETVVVSGAAGATGSIAGQIARIQGCHVVGIAGGPVKCRWLTETARFDAAIDYKREDVGARLRDLCPKGIDVYFDNVGGEILDAALARIADHARVVLCGGISLYNEKGPPPGPRNYLSLVVRRARMEGFLVLDYLPRMGEGIQKLLGWVRAGEIVFEEDVQQGFENIPKTLLRLFQGKNLGKQLLEVAKPPLGGAA